MQRLQTLVCEGCSSLSGTPLAGLPALTTLRVCRLNRLTYVCDDTCRDLALLPKVRGPHELTAGMPATRPSLAANRHACCYPVPILMQLSGGH